MEEEGKVRYWDIRRRNTCRRKEQEWGQRIVANQAGGIIIFIIGIAFIWGGISNEGKLWGSLFCIMWGSICLWCAFKDFQSAKGIKQHRKSRREKWYEG